MLIIVLIYVSKGKIVDRPTWKGAPHTYQPGFNKEQHQESIQIVRYFPLVQHHPGKGKLRHYTGYAHLILLGYWRTRIGLFPWRMGCKNDMGAG